MKKLILLAIISLTLLSCDNSKDHVSIEYPVRVTTYQEINMTKDTMLVVVNKEENTISCYDINTNMKIYEAKHSPLIHIVIVLLVGIVLGALFVIFHYNTY